MYTSTDSTSILFTSKLTANCCLYLALLLSSCILVGNHLGVYGGAQFDVHGSFEIPKDIAFETEVNEQGQASITISEYKLGWVESCSGCVDSNDHRHAQLYLSRMVMLLPQAAQPLKVIADVMGKIAVISDIICWQCVYTMFLCAHVVCAGGCGRASRLRQTASRSVSAPCYQ
jgi:hypothetical protein